MPKAVVLGAGMVGSVMAADLASDEAYSVTVVDRSEDALAAAARRSGGRVRTLRADLADPPSVRRVVEPCDVVLGAMASRLGFQTLQAVVEAGRPYCDISFMPEDALALDELARAKGVTAVVDCGVAPGMSNMLAASGVARLDEATRVAIYVGGLPRERRWPFQYKAGFAPSDVIEEYTRPARFVEHGEIVVRPALTDAELIDVEGVGTLEAFNTDGLRSLLHTLGVPHMTEKTLRYPGHVELMRVFRETGFFRTDAITLPDGATVRPIDVTSALMFPMWSWDENEPDLTVMRVLVAGVQGGRPVGHRWDLVDHYDRSTGTTSMARTTAFPCVIVARLLVAGVVDQPGVIPPETLGRDGALLEQILGQLQERGVHYAGPVTETDPDAWR